MNSLEHRLAALERSNRRLKLVAWGLCVVFVACAGMAFAQPEKTPDVIKAKRFEVTGDKGSAIIILGKGAEGGMISTWSHDNKIRASISADDNGNGLIETYNTRGNGLVALGASANADCGLIKAYNSFGKAAVNLWSDKTGNGVVTTYNGAGKSIVLLTATEEGDGMLTTFDRNGASLIGFGITQDTREGVLTQFNRGGKTARTWP